MTLLKNLAKTAKLIDEDLLIWYAPLEIGAIYKNKIRFPASFANLAAHNYGVGYEFDHISSYIVFDVIPSS